MILLDPLSLFFCANVTYRKDIILSSIHDKITAILSCIHDNITNFFLLEDFNKPKLVYAELARTGNAFTFDINQNMVGNTGYILTVPENEKDNLMYLLAFLNSRTTLYCLNQITSRFDENGWRWLHQFVEQLYVPMFVDKNKIVIEINKIGQKSQEKVSEAINTIVASIYHFTKEEEVYINQTLSKY